MFSNLKNLNNTWVIVSRHNGNIFFKRRRKVSRLKNYPDNECLFHDELSAKHELERLNSTRKKCKYELENASKYFVNNFKVEGWDNKYIKNEPIPIKIVQERKVNLISTNEIKEKLIKSYEHNIKRSNDRIEQERKEIERINIVLTKINNVSFEQELKQFETQGDRIVKVLFGDKPVEIKPQPKYDEVPF